MKPVLLYVALITVCSTSALGGQDIIQLITPPPTHVKSGASFGTRLIAKVTDSLGVPLRAARVSLEVTGPADASPVRIVGVRSATTDSTGLASFTGLGLSGGVGSYILTFTVGTATTAFPIVLEPGDATSLRVLARMPDDNCPDNRESVSVSSTPARSQFCVPFRVLLTDDAGNEVKQSGLPVTSELSSGGGTLNGTATVETNRDGVAVFTDLSIDGPRGERTLRFTADGLKSDVSAPVYIDYAKFDSHLTIGAIKTVSGSKPRDEFFDLSFVFPIWLDRGPIGFFTLASIDVALNPDQVNQVTGDTTSASSEETTTGTSSNTPPSDLAEASASINFMTSDSNSGARKIFGGLVARIFEGRFLFGTQIGSIELPSSALHGSHFTFGWLRRMGAVPDPAQGPDGAMAGQRARHNLFLNFLIRSETAPFLSAMSVRATIIVPLGRRDPDIQTRIVLSVPFKDLFQISSGH